MGSSIAQNQVQVSRVTQGHCNHLLSEQLDNGIGSQQDAFQRVGGLLLTFLKSEPRRRLLSDCLRVRSLGFRRLMGESWDGRLTGSGRSWEERGDIYTLSWV